MSFLRTFFLIGSLTLGFVASTMGEFLIAGIALMLLVIRFALRNREGTRARSWFEFFSDLGLALIAIGVGLAFFVPSSLPLRAKQMETHPYLVTGIIVIVGGCALSSASLYLARRKKTD